ncbi:MAG: AAA family ATPase [Candidatus Liptonbacteria bacterium]
MNKTIILAIVGLPGAGKTEATQYMMEKTGWPKVYFGDVTFDEMRRLELEINETNERKTREDLRKEHGMGAYAKLSLPKIKKALEQSPAVIVESLYSWEEYLIMKENFGNDFKCLAILASPEIRMGRMLQRPTRPLRNEEEFLSRDYAQINNSHQAGPIARADYFIINEGALTDMRVKLDELIAELKR